MQKSRKQNNFWLYEEDEILINLIKFLHYFSKAFLNINKKSREFTEKNQKICWTKIEEKFNLLSPCSITRLDKHLRERWLNHLDPNLTK